MSGCASGSQQAGDEVFYLLCVCWCCGAAFRAMSLLWLQNALARQGRGNAHGLGCSGGNLHSTGQLMVKERHMR